MYALVSAIGKLKAVGSRWTSLSVAAVTLSTLFRNYEEVYLVLSNPFYEGNRTLILSSIRDENLSSELTVSQFLINNGNETLPVVEDLYQINTQWAKYSDAFRSHYKVEPIASSGHINSSIPLSERTWLSLTRAETNYQLFFKSCLVTINGLIHRTDTDGNRIYVVDGMKSCRHSGRNQIGITSFQKLGELEFMAISEAMIHRRYADEPLKSRVYIDIGTAKPNKLPMLVVGGYLHLLDSRTFFQVSDTVYAYNIRNVPWRERYFESKELIDLSHFDLEVFNHNDNQVTESELYSDEIIKKVFTLSQSFIVWIDNTDLFVEREALRRSTLPNMYTSHIEPIYPLTTGYGKLSEYWRVKEHNQWAVNVADGLKWNYDFNTTTESGLVSYDNSASPFNPLEYSRAHFMKIGCDALEVIEE
jgi:hypothetical protein